MSFQQREREKLAQLMLDLGPDAPTLCEEWTTKDLAAHLFVREKRTHMAGGYLVPALKSLTDAEEAKVKERPYEHVVQAWAAGPPLHIKPLDRFVNVSENFIHHEDVRRGGQTAESVEPREFSRDVETKLMAAVKMMGKMSLSSSEVPVVLTPPNHPAVTIGGKRGVSDHGDRVVRVMGDPGELLLWVTGRDVVRVDIQGEATDIAKVKRQF